MPAIDDARYALGVFDDVPVIAWETSYHGWLLPSAGTLIVATHQPGPLPDDATDTAIAQHLAAEGAALVIGAPYDAPAPPPPPAWTLELAGRTFVMRPPDDDAALTAEDHSAQAAVWTAMAAGAARVSFFTGTGLFNR